jgi:phosphate-selective porin OprO/OprP
MKPTLLGAWLPLLILVSTVHPGALRAQDEPSTYDKIWGLAQWYEGDEDSPVQRVEFRGRFQYEYARVTDGATHDEWNVRRLRLGVRSRLLNGLTIHVEAEFNPQERDPFFLRLTDARVAWSSTPTFGLTVGKQSSPFMNEGATSSKELLTIDRSNLANNMWFTQEYMPGVTVSGEAANWSYFAGLYSSGTANREFGEFDGSAYALFGLGYDFAESLGVDQALVTGNYVYQDPDPKNTFTRQLEHVGSLNFRVEDARWGIRGDVSAAQGYLGQSDLWGTMMMPFVNITPALQLVARHTYVESEDENGVRLARYENQLVSGRGDRYQEVYLGANYYLYGHNLKLQGGVQFGDMSDAADDGGAYSGVAATIGLRVGW